MSVMTSGTRPRIKSIRRGREGVRDRERPGPSENQANEIAILDTIFNNYYSGLKAT